MRYYFTTAIAAIVCMGVSIARAEKPTVSQLLLGEWEQQSIQYGKGREETYPPEERPRMTLREKELTLDMRDGDSDALAIKYQLDVSASPPRMLCFYPFLKTRYILQVSQEKLLLCQTYNGKKWPDKLDPEEFVVIVYSRVKPDKNAGGK